MISGTLSSETQSPFESVWNPDAHGGGRTVHYDDGLKDGDPVESLIAALIFNLSLMKTWFLSFIYSLIYIKEALCIFDDFYFNFSSFLELTWIA